MTRGSRTFAAGTPLHVTHRGNNRMPVFSEEADYRTFLRLLENIVSDFSIELYAFALMTNHYHLLLTPPDRDRLSRSMNRLAWRYSCYFNQKYARTGTLWGERYRSTVVDGEVYLLRCLRYIEQNPVRARIVAGPDQYRWTSYAVHGQGQTIAWLTPHPVYTALGHSSDERAMAYRAICGASLTDEELLSIRMPRAAVPGR